MRRDLDKRLKNLESRESEGFPVVLRNGGDGFMYDGQGKAVMTREEFDAKYPNAIKLCPKIGILNSDQEAV